MQDWELWYPDAAATGLAFARGRLELTTVLWVHAAPPTLSVAVHAVADGARVGQGEHLARTSKEMPPTTRLALENGTITREDRWPLPAESERRSSSPAAKWASCAPGGTPPTGANGAGRWNSPTAGKTPATPAPARVGP